MSVRHLSSGVGAFPRAVSHMGFGIIEPQYTITSAAVINLTGGVHTRAALFAPPLRVIFSPNTRPGEFAPQVQPGRVVV